MTWLDVMPAIPLARSVPVVARGGVERDVVVEVDAKGDAMGTYVGPFQWLERYQWLPDLDDPQGFGYALRWWADRAPTMDVYGGDPLSSSSFQRWIHGETDDADRLALAQACAEVADG